MWFGKVRNCIVEVYCGKDSNIKRGNDDILMKEVFLGILYFFYFLLVYRVWEMIRNLNNGLY